LQQHGSSPSSQSLLLHPVVFPAPREKQMDAQEVTIAKDGCFLSAMA